MGFDFRPKEIADPTPKLFVKLGDTYIRPEAVDVVMSYKGAGNRAALVLRGQTDTPLVVVASVTEVIKALENHS